MLDPSQCKFVCLLSNMIFSKQFSLLADFSLINYWTKESSV